MKKSVMTKIQRISDEARSLRKRWQDERGVAVPLVAIFMVVLIGLAGVGVDTGRVAGTATEAQNAADIAALAGVRALADEEDPTTRANQTLAMNKIDSSPAAGYLQSLEVGNLDSNYTFTANGTPSNAVRATVVAQVDTVVLGSIGFPNATVTREAIATLGGMGSGVPTLPITIGECNYQADCYHQSCMPYLAQAPNTTNNSAWTGFFTGASQSNISSLMPAPAGNGNSTLIKVGDFINLTNGQSTPLLRDVEDLLDDGQRTFVIPIVDCNGNFNQAQEVRGFAKIEIDYVKSTGSPKGIWLHGIYDGSPGSPGGGNFGLNVISLAK